MPNKKNLTFAVSIVAVLTGALAYGVTKAKSEASASMFSSRATAESTHSVSSQPAPTSQQDENESDAKVAALTLRPNGFEPTEITIPAGKYLMVVRNRTGLDQFALRLERTTGARLQDVRLPRYKRDWKQFMQLTPDTYLLSEVDHPDWVCRITVTPN